MNVDNIKVTEEKFSFYVKDNIYSLCKKYFNKKYVVTDFYSIGDYEHFVEGINIFNNTINECVNNNSNNYKFTISHNKQGRTLLHANKISDFSKAGDRPYFIAEYSYQINPDKFYDCSEWTIDIAFYPELLNMDLSEFNNVIDFKQNKLKMTFNLENGNTVVSNNMYEIIYYNTQPNHCFNETEKLLRDKYLLEIGVKMKLKIINHFISVCLVDKDNNICDMSFLSLKK